MIENGIVERTNGKYATVKVNKKDECSKCGMCLFPNNADSITFRSLNSINAKVGDKVTIKTSERAKISGVFLAFGIPLILIVLSVVIGYLLVQNELIILATSVMVVALWFVVLALIDKRLKKHKVFLTEIIEIKGEN